MMSYVSEMRTLVGHRMLLLVGANVIILDDKQRILLQQRLDGSWGLPGGLMEPGESLEQTAVREVKEETNIDIDELHFLKVFSGKEFTFTLNNNDEINVVTALYWSKKWHGSLINDKSEGLSLAFFTTDDMPDNMSEEYQLYLRYFVSK
ncbi:MULTISPECIES: NUDIX hydrolase [unclassified Pantoea]|uniref:NUDIX hydrolase n=1 Tax=unclassified Pantoea TaxID=2630326 RepID=UPI0028A69F48|nr:NUDIX hydrolase [Pantoea sp. CTOTU50773]